MPYVPHMRKIPRDPNRLISTAEAAAILDVHVSTVSRMVEDERLTPAGKAPGKRGAFMFRLGDIDALVGASA